MEFNLNQLIKKGRWNQIKGEIKKDFASVADSDFLEAEGDQDKLIGMLQEKLGKSKAQLIDYLKGKLEAQEDEPTTTN